MKQHVLLRSERLDISWRWSTRNVVLLGGLVVGTILAGCLTAAFGDYHIPVWTVVQTILGHGSVVDHVVLVESRLPRIVEAILVGGALGLSGALFQGLSRNPLASPDVIGVNEGAAVVAVWMILYGAPRYLFEIGVFAGALAALALIAIFGVRRNFSIYRLILVGVGINVFGAAVVSYVLTTAPTGDLAQLQAAQQWLIGSVSAASWQNVAIIAVAVGALGPFALASGRKLDTLQLGDALACALGVRIKRLQITLATLGALLAAVVVSVAGPIGFVAFLSPHIARRITRSSGTPSLAASMAIGGLLILLADYAAQRLLEPTEIPVGILTVLLGAPYLLFLLFRAERDVGIG